MMKINTICYNRLRNDEFLGLHQNIVELTASITGEEIRPSIEAYRKAVTEYANLIEVDVDETAASVVSRLDKERNAAYAASRNFAKSLKSLADKDVVATGEKLRKIFAENADPVYHNQDQSTGIFTNIVSSLKAIGDAKTLNARTTTTWPPYRPATRSSPPGKTDSPRSIVNGAWMHSVSWRHLQSARRPSKATKAAHSLSRP